MPIPDAVRSALFVNLLTEDNLPYYFHTIDRMFGRTGRLAGVVAPLDGRRGPPLDRSARLHDGHPLARPEDARGRSDDRRCQAGRCRSPTQPIDGFVYVALQELATRIAHRNTGRALRRAPRPDHPAAKAGYDVISRVAADENFHFLFYRDLTSAALEIAPSMVLPAIERQVREFEMPGTGIPGFKHHAQAIANAGLYNLSQHHEQILEPVVMKWWKIESLQGLTAEAELAREALIRQIQRIGKVARRLAERAREAAERARSTLVDRTAEITGTRAIRSS